MQDERTVRLRLREFIEEIGGQVPITDETPVELTSLQQIEFALKLEEEFNVAIDEEPGWQTVDEVVMWLEEKGIR